MRENFLQPLAIAFQANQEMQGRKTEREIQHESISHAMQNSKVEQLQDKFKALPRVHYMHTIYLFEVRKVKSPIIQTVCKSEPK